MFCGDIFFYSTANAKIHFILQGRNFFLQNYEKKKFILGLVEAQNRLYFFDRTNSIYSLSIQFELFSKLSKYVQDGGKTELTEIPQELKDTFSKVLSEFGFNKAAFKLVSNQDMKFEIALQLGLGREGIICLTQHSK